MRATANESESTPTDIKQFTDMLEAGKVGLLVVNIQEETELTGKIVTAAKSSQYSDRGADRADAGAVRFPDGLDGRARRRVLPSHLMRICAKPIRKSI